jgi:glycosyltransferase involved in cell wall biosynthesis
MPGRPSRLHPRRVARSLRARSRRAGRAVTARILRRLAAAPPSEAARRRGERRVVILLGSAWGMGGTIRAALNLAGHLAPSQEVEVLSAYRRFEEPFMGAFPAGVTVTALDDQRHDRKGGGGWRGRLVRWLRAEGSVLIHPEDVRYKDYSLLTDLQLVRRLRKGAGVLIGTRPSLNMLIAELGLPGWITVGEEQMNLGVHRKPLRRAMARSYGGLDALVVLTESDVQAYRTLLGDGAPRLARIPNTVKPLIGPRADPDAKVLLAAGRYTSQKGFDVLIPAYAKVAAARPDWRLRLCGRGRDAQRLRELIAEHDLQEHVTLAPPAEDLPGEMERASIYVLSSRYEGFPLVLLEAMGKGMAVVAFDCPTGPADIIRDGRNGLLVPHMDGDALGDAMLRMIEDDDLRHRCAAAAVDAADGYTLAAVGPMWDALLAELRAAAR